MTTPTELSATIAQAKITIPEYIANLQAENAELKRQNIILLEQVGQTPKLLAQWNADILSLYTAP